MTKSCRFFKYLALVVTIVVLVLLCGVAWLFYGNLPSEAGKTELTGLSAKVEVYRDPYGVPHIFAANRADALRALGYLHASDRFFQMEMQRRAGQGRLAEAVGKDMLGVDQFIRALGLYGLAESSYAAMEPQSQQLFQAYADGVNGWLDSHRFRLPPEFTLLHIHPDPWKPADSVVWGKLMALQLSHNYKLEILRAQLTGKLSPAQMKTLFPVWGNAPVTMEPRTAKQGDLLPQNTSSPPPVLTGGVRGGHFERSSNSALPLPLPQKREGGTTGAAVSEKDVFQKLSSITSLDHAASNEWVIDGSRTQSGKPILANDPHLGLEAPILWYLARIVTPNFSVKGATVAGLPVVLLGQNSNIAWGMTTTGSDVQDIFIETIDPKNPDNYLTPKGSIPFKTHTEEIKIKDAPSVTLTVRATRHGPVLSDIDPEMAAIAGQGKVMALAFTGLGDKDRTAEALLRINQAATWDDFLDAMQLYQSPPQNVVFADIKGDIGFINPGLVPIRKKGNGTVPVDGASGAYDWKGTIPFDSWPSLYNPPAGFVFNANNALVSANNSHFYGMDWEEPYRAMRLRQFLDSADPQTLDSSAAMQADHVSLVARQFLPYLLRLKFEATGNHAQPRALEAQDMLRDWDGTMNKPQPQPLIFETWLWKIHKALLVDQAGQSLRERGPFAADSIAAILIGKDNSWCKTKNCDDVAAQALIDAVDWLTKRQGEDMKKWRWGKEHITLLKNKFFMHLPYFDRISDLSVSSSGDFYTLDRGGSFDPSVDLPFARQHGGGYRGIYDLANPDRSRFMIATGESENIYSRHYGDLVRLWNNVKYITLSGTQAELAAQNASTLELFPIKQ